MKLLDKIVSYSFLERQDKQTEFYPWGAMAGGYILKSGEARRIKFFLKLYFFISLFCLFLAVLLINSSLYIVPILIALLLYKICVRLMVQKMDGVQRVPWVEAIRNVGKNYSPLFLNLVNAGCLIFIFASLFTIFFERPGLPDLLLSFLTIGFFGFCVFICTRMSRLKSEISE